MKLKIVGIGKCGVRIAYDLFAHTRDIPSAYQIRIEAPDNPYAQFLRSLGIYDKAQKGARHIKQFFRDILYDLNGVSKFIQEPQYVTIESDSENNEIVNHIQNVVLTFKNEAGPSIPETGKKNEFVFPGKNFDLNGYKGGCDFHVISEQLAETWENIPKDITDSADFDIFATSFSIGGGTGGGSGLTISRRAKEAREKPKQECHFLGLGILPKSDEKYAEDDLALSMAEYEKFSTGRFMISLYGGRTTGSMNSIWLFSNDMLRFLVDSEDKKVLAAKEGEINLNLSMINTYIAQSLAIVANSSSPGVQSDENLDARELNNRLDHSVFIAGMAQSKIGGGDQNPLFEVKKLLFSALSNIYEEDGAMYGMSVPVENRYLLGIQELLADDGTDDKEFLKKLEMYDAEDGPIEFVTPLRVLVIYGQPSSRYSTFKKERIERACKKIFKSQIVPYSFRHSAESEYLLILIIDPLIRPILSSIYFYVNNAWFDNDSNMREFFDDIVGDDQFNAKKLEETLQYEEGFPNSIYGDAVSTVNEILETENSLKIEQQQVIAAFKQLHEIYHRKPLSTNTSSGLAEKRRKQTVSSNTKTKK